MKVNPLWDAFRFVSSAQGGGNPQQKKQQKQNRQGRENQDQNTFEVSEESVGQAVEAFGADTAHQASGLQATMEGQGPALRVVLKDGSGALIRQFTGDEFLKLRDAVSKEGRSRGKILDQKL